ncbi:hypothetical protein OIU84_000487, partial [Salix udensis]
MISRSYHGLKPAANRAHTRVSFDSNKKAVLIPKYMSNRALVSVFEVKIAKLEKSHVKSGASSSVILAIFAHLIIRSQYKRRRKLLESQLVSQGRELRIEYSFLRKVAGVPTKFRYKELEEATDNFQALLGQGSSASVFKGILNDGTSVA